MDVENHEMGIRDKIGHKKWVGQRKADRSPSDELDVDIPARAKHQLWQFATSEVCLSFWSIIFEA